MKCCGTCKFWDKQDTFRTQPCSLARELIRDNTFPSSIMQSYTAYEHGSTCSRYEEKEIPWEDCDREQAISGMRCPNAWEVQALHTAHGWRYIIVDQDGFMIWDDQSENVVYDYINRQYRRRKKQ